MSEPAVENNVVPLSINLQKMEDGDLFTQSRKLVVSADDESVFRYANELCQAEQSAEYVMGAILHRIREEEIYADHYDSFKEYVESQLGYRMQKAAALIKVYSVLDTSGIEWEDVKPLGWSRLKALLGVLTKKNVKKIVKKVLAENMNVPTAKEYARQLAKKADTTGDEGEPEETEVTTDDVSEEPVNKRATFSIQAYEDQIETIQNAIAEYRDQHPDCGSDAVALENISLSYLSGDYASGDEGVSVDEALAKMDYDEAREIVKKIYPELLVEPNVMAAMKHASLDEAIDAFNEVFPDAELILATN